MILFEKKRERLYPSVSQTSNLLKMSNVDFPWSCCLCLTITESCKVKQSHLTSRFYHFVVYSIAVGTVYGHATARKKFMPVVGEYFPNVQKTASSVLNLTAKGLGQRVLVIEAHYFLVLHT